MLSRRFFVAGRVQGVGFRAATQATAQRLNLRGWVRNLPDGRVEVLAAGSREALEDLERWLFQGPPGARVDGIQHLDGDAADAGTRFEIR